MSSIVLTKQDDQDNPASGKVRVYIKEDGVVYKKDENGIETPLSSVNARSYHGVYSTTATLSFNDTSHILTVGLVSSHFIYWYLGVEVDLTIAPTCDLDDYVTLTANTLYYVYFDDTMGELKASDSAWNIKTTIPIALIFWNGTNGFVYNELHNYTRGVDWHIWAHTTVGTRYGSGLNLTKPTTTDDNLLQIESGVIHDEDIIFNVSQQTTSRIVYLASAGVFTIINSSLPYAGTSGQPQYLRTSDYSLQNVGVAEYVCMWVYAVNDTSRCIYIIPTHSTAAYNTIALARAEVSPSLLGLNLSPEMKLIYRFIYKGDGNFQEYTDYRLTSSLPSGGVSNVGANSVAFTPYLFITSATVQTAVQEVADGLISASYDKRVVELLVIDFSTSITTGDGKCYFRVPSILNGYNLVSCFATVITAGVTGTTDIQIANVTDSVDMLSTKLTIDSGETDSKDATPAVIDATKDDVVTGDLLRIDVDAISTTAPKGLIIGMTFQLP